MRWTVRIDGGPKRVNHAAVAIGDKIYSFGGYCSGDVFCKNAPIDVHRLDTVSNRWKKVEPNPPFDRDREMEYRRGRLRNELITIANNYANQEGDSDEPEGAIMLGDISSDDEMYMPEQLRRRDPRQFILDEIEDIVDQVVEENVDRALMEELLEIGDFEPEVEQPPSKILPHPYEAFPYQRYGHTVVAYNGRAYLWGGRNDEAGASEILHEYDPISNTWSVVKINGASPMARDGHTAVVYGTKMFVYGGFEEETQLYSQDTFAFDFLTKQWTEFKTVGDPPQYRDFHAACVLGNRMYVFGGRCDESGAMHSNQDFYCEKLKYLDLDTGRWHEPKVYGQRPCGRRSHTLWSYNGKIYLFGGYCSIDDRHFNDLFEFCPSRNTWRKVEPKGVGPCARRRMCTVMVGHKMYLFGGTMPMNRSKQQQLMDLADLYVLDYYPTLFTLSACTVIRHRLHEPYSHVLPFDIKRQLQWMSMPNKISLTRPRHDAMG